jgi:phytoene synthase
MDQTDAERALALSYAARGRDAAAALLALDDRLAAILRRTTEPLVGQMRLTWWREALEKLDAAPPPAEPVLAALAAEVLPRGIRGVDLAPIIDGWEALLEEPLDAAAIERHAMRGRALFEALARVIGASGDPVAAAGEGWALADLVRHLSDADARRRAADLAKPRLDAALAARWSRNGRPLGALAHLARLDLAGRQRSPWRVARLLAHRLTGR